MMISPTARARQMIDDDKTPAELAKERASKAELAVPGIHDGSLTIQQEVELKHVSARLGWEIAKRELELAGCTEALDRYEKVFGSIRLSTGVNTIDEMVAAFVAAEDRNFALINMLNDVHKETEVVELENSRLRAQVAAAREASAPRVLRGVRPELRRGSGIT